MNRTTVLLPSELKKQAQEQARREGISLADLIRQALQSHLTRPGNGRDEDPFYSDEAVFDGEVPTDLSTDHDKYLYEESA